jgi:hypothetical protein
MAYVAIPAEFNARMPVRSPQITQQRYQHEPHLRERWSAGCMNAAQLWQELRDRGYAGGLDTSGTTSRVSAETRPPRSRPCRAESPGRDQLDHALWFLAVWVTVMERSL